MALLKGLKEVEEAQKKAEDEKPGAPAEGEKRPETAHGWVPPAEAERKPEPEPRRRGMNVALPKGAEKLDPEPEKKVSVGDVNKKRKDYGRDYFRDED